MHRGLDITLDNSQCTCRTRCRSRMVCLEQQASRLTQNVTSVEKQYFFPNGTGSSRNYPSAHTGHIRNNAQEVRQRQRVQKNKRSQNSPNGRNDRNDRNDRNSTLRNGFQHLTDVVRRRLTLIDIASMILLKLQYYNIISFAFRCQI